jgi:hypothetical protein
MSEWVISETLYSTTFVGNFGACDGYNFTYDFKINKKGNVYVKKGCDHFRCDQPIPSSELFSIIDNIPVPEYIIEKIKTIIKTHIGCGKGNSACREEKMLMFFDTVKYFKEYIKEQLENPHITRGHIINTYQEEIKRLKWEIESKNNIISEKDKSLSKKVVAETKLVQDLREENRELYELVARLKGKETPKTPSNSWYSYSREPEYKNTLSTCLSNPGGATICTQSNAQNSMVYNESSGNYEPGY